MASAATTRRGRFARRRGTPARAVFATRLPAKPHRRLLTRLVQAANLRVYETGTPASPGGSNMATTLVACALRYDRAVVAHAGDSRCYLIRDGRATLLTRDHTVAAEQVRLGHPLREEAASRPTVTSGASLGNDLFVNVDIGRAPGLPGDVLLLCSDGLHNSVEVRYRLRVTGRGADLNAAARRLIDLANQRDGSDNISVQLIRIRDVERIGMYRGRPYKLR